MIIRKNQFKNSFDVGLIVFTGSLSLVTVMSSVVVALMCLRLRGQKEIGVDGADGGTGGGGGGGLLRPLDHYAQGSDRFSTLMSHMTLRTSRTDALSDLGTVTNSKETLRPRIGKSEYIHSNQARIP